MIHTVKGFGIVNEAEIDVFLELSCFFNTKMKFRVFQSTLEYSELKIIGLELEKRMSLEINFQSYSVCFPEGLCDASGSGFGVPAEHKADVSLSHRVDSLVTTF